MVGVYMIIIVGLFGILWVYLMGREGNMLWDSR